MAQRHLGQVDRDTGELIEGYLAVIQPKRHNGFTTGWYAMSQNGTALLLEYLLTKKLGMSDMQVLFALLKFLDFENLIQVPQSELAEELGMKKPNVNRAIKKLIELELILEGPKIGRSRSYRLNPHFGWKGSAKKHHEFLELQERMAAARISEVVEGGRGHAPSP